MAAFVLELLVGNLIFAALSVHFSMLAGKRVKRVAFVRACCFVVFLGLLTTLANEVVHASPQAPPAEVKGSPKTSSSPEVKAVTNVAPVINPRGEPLLFDSASTDISVSGPTWWCVAASPDKKIVATAQGSSGGKDEVKIWDLATGKIVHVIPEPQGTRCVAYSPDGTILVTGNHSNKLRFYTTKDYKLCAEGVDGHTGVINSLCFFKNGKYLATAAQDKSTRIWDISALYAKGKPAGETTAIRSVAIIDGPNQAIFAVAVSADGKTLLTGCQDRFARCYDLPETLPAPGTEPLRLKKERLLLDGHNSAVAAVAISPNGQLFATGDWNALVLIRTSDGKQTDSSFRFQASVRTLEFSSDGKLLAAGAGNITPPGAPGEVRIWNVAEKREVAYRNDYPEVVRSVIFLHDDKTVASVGPDQALTLWEYARNERKRLASPTIPYTPQPLLAAAVSPDGSLLAFSGETPSVFIYNRSSSRLVAELKGHEDVVPGLVFSPDGKTLATASYDKSIKLWNTETWKDTRSLTGHKGWVFSASFSPDGKTLASGSYDKSIRIWDLQKGESQAQLNEHTAGIRSVAFSRDGKKLVSGGSDRVVRIWDVAEGKVLLALKGHKKAVRAVAFSPDGKSVASGSEDQTVKLWDAETGKETHTFSELPDMVTAVSYSPKGQTLAAGTFQGPIALLDPLSGRTRQILRAHTESVSALVFADRGQHLISISLDRATNMKQWSVSKAALAVPTQAIGMSTSAITSAASTSDGTLVVLGGSNGSISLWDSIKGNLAPYPITRTLGIAHLAVSDARIIAAIGKDGSLLVSDRDGKELWKGKGSYAAFASIGQFLAVAEGREIVLREDATGKEVRRFAGGHDGDVILLAFSPDGMHLASAGQDTKVRLWNVNSGEKLQATPAFGNESTIKHLAFSPDGIRFAVSAYGPEQPPPDDMTGNFRPVRDVRVFAVPPPGAAFANPIGFSPQPTDQPITGLFWDRSGKVLVMPASDGTVRFNDFLNNNARETKRFRAHDGAVLAAAMTDDALVTVGEDLALRTWSQPQQAGPSRAARIIGPFRGSPVLAGEFDGSGRYLFAITAWDKMLHVFNRPSSPGSLEFYGNYGGVSAVAYSPNGKLIATGHENGELLLWDAATGKRVGRLSGLEFWVRGVAFTPDSDSLVALSQGRENPERPGDAVVFDIPTQTIRQRMTGPVGHPWHVVLNHDGSLAAAPCSDSSIRIWDVNTGNLVRTLETPKSARTAAFSPDGTLLAAGVFDGTVRVWNTSTWVQTREVELPEALPNGITFTPNGKEVLIATLRRAGAPACFVDCSIFSWRIDTDNAKPREFEKGHAGGALTIAVLKDGKTVVSGGGREKELGEIKVWDLPSGKLLGEFRGLSTWVEALAAAPDGKTVVSGGWAGGQPGELRQWDAGGFRPVADVPATKGPYVSSAATSPDGKILALGCGDGSVTTFDMTDPAKPIKRQTVEGKHASIGSLTFDSNGKRFVTADDRGKIIVWDAEKTVPLKEWQASTKLITFRAKFTPDGKSVVTAAGLWNNPKIPGEIRVWNPENGEELTRFPDQSAAVWDFAFLDGGKTLISTQALNGTKGEAPVKVWDFATRSERRSVWIPGGMRCLAVSPDERYLAVANHGGEIKLISTSTWQVISTVPPHGKVVFRLSFDASSKTLSSISEDGSVGITRIAGMRAQ